METDRNEDIQIAATFWQTRLSEIKLIMYFVLFTR